MKTRTALAISLLTAVAGCSPQLPDVPFACAADATCPEGYTCQSTICVKNGTHLGSSRPERITWINAGEMTWFASGAGATLVVNDGFTAGAHGIYAVDVGADGHAGAPRLLLGYGDEYPMASAAVALDDGRYGIATLSFPSVASDDLVLEVIAVDREAPEGSTPSRESLFTEKEPFLGGAEPAYVAAETDGKSIDVGWTRPSQGGRVEVLHIEKQGSTWSATTTSSQPLPADVPPLSGDCVLWKSALGLTLRVGFESFAVAQVDDQGQLGALSSLDDVPLYAFGDQVLALRYGDYDEANAAYGASYVLETLDGKEIAVDGAGVIQESLEPFTSVAYADGALVAPLSDDPSFATLGIGFRSPSQKLVRVAEVARPGTDALYSARAFGKDGRAYLAWTSFHEALMDLWVSVAPMNASAKTAVAPAGIGPSRVARYQLASPPARRRP